MNHVSTPGIENPKPLRNIKNRGIWLVFLLLLIFAFVIWKITAASPSGSTHQRRGYDVKTAQIPVTLASVTAQDFPLYLDGLGTVQAFNSAQVSARVSGLIQEIKFQEGQEVKQGDLLAVIDPRTFQAQYDQALSKKLQDEAQLQSAQVLLTRDQELLSKAVLDKQTYDTQKYLVAQMEAAVQSDAATLEVQKAQLDWTQVRAPIAGRTGVRQIDVGNQVSTGGNSPNSSNNVLVTINQIQPIYVSFTLPQQDMAQIHDPLLARKNLEVIALDRNNRTVLSKGVLSVIDNQIDTTTATVKLKAVFSNEDYKLWPGQFVNVRLLVGSLSGALVVPSEAIQLGPDGSYVFVVDDDHKAVMRPVTTGSQESGFTLITSGLKLGEKVVTDGQYRLQQGSEVTLSSSQTGHKEPKKY